MPLKKAVLAYQSDTGKKEYAKYYSCMTTIGPVKEEWAGDLLKWVMAFWQKSGVVWEAPPRLKFEISDDKKYPHFHLGEKSVRRKPYAAFVNQLQVYMKKYKDEKPSGYDKKVGFSITPFIVPCSEKTASSAKVLRGMALIDHYLDNPTKEKDTGGGNYVLEVVGFNAAEYIANERAEIAQLGDPEIVDKHTREYIKLRLEMVQRMTQWLSKYYKSSASSELVPLSKLLLESQPPLKNITKAREELIKACRPGPRFF